MENNSGINPIAAVLNNVKHLSEELIRKLLLAEEFATPQIATYSLNSFQMTAPQSKAS